MKKIGLICIVLVLALGTLGVGYATWSQELIITETVNTGKFCMEFAEPVSLLDELAPPPIFPLLKPEDGDWNADEGFNNVHQMNKNVGWGEIELVDPLNGDCFQGILVKLHDVYPGYYNHAYYIIHNCGTIPAVLPEVIVRNSAGDIIGIITHDAGMVTMDLDGNGVDDFQILYGNHIGDFQYNPCERIDISFEMLVLQDDDPTWQGNSFSFYLELPFIQYNGEYP